MVKRQIWVTISVRDLKQNTTPFFVIPRVRQTETAFNMLWNHSLITSTTYCGDVHSQLSDFQLEKFMEQISTVPNMEVRYTINFDNGQYRHYTHVQ